MSDEGRLVADRYRVIKRIGTGAMGVVWQAHDRILHRTVAIKQLLLPVELDEHDAEEARQRTMREGRIAARLHHPNAITVFDVVTDDNGQPCLIMEYLESTSLARVLQQQTTLPPPEVARIGTQIAAALKAAHAVGIVHRDVKPGNILLADNGIAKLTDFGISRANDDVTVTKTGMIAGTPAYLAPEVAIGGDPGAESDVFALGSTLYAATEGQPPFGLSENTLSLLHAVAAGQINPPRQSGALTSVLAVMLHPDVQHRPTADECAELLDAVARGETPLGELSEEQTQVYPAVQEGGTNLLRAVGGAAGAALPSTADDDLVPRTHSGTLNDAESVYHGQEPGEGDDPASGHSGTAHEEYHQVGHDVDVTQVVPAASDYDEDYGGYSDEDYYYGHYDDSGYDDYYAHDDHDARESHSDEDYYDDHYDDSGYDDDHDEDYLAARQVGDELDDGSSADQPAHWSSWAVPAALGSLVVAGMAVFAIWLFGGSGGSDAEQDPLPRHQIATTSTASSTTTTPTSTESSSESVEPTTEATTTTIIVTRVPAPPPQPPAPEPTGGTGPPNTNDGPTEPPPSCPPSNGSGDSCSVPEPD